jgi:hypothetical protein
MSDIAPTAFGIIGAGIGSMFGMPWLGYAFGSMLGSALFPPDPIRAEGPRLQDLKVQSSTYGRMIPIVEGGAVRIAGNLIWSAGIKETKHKKKTRAGGKGGGQKVEQTTYTYSSSFAIGLCEGEIGGVRRIWANGKLLADLPPVTGGGAIPVVFAKYAASRQWKYTVYKGSETQSADPLIASFEGAANTPGFRGLAYVVFDDMPLADFGNAIPNLEFEIIPSATESSAYDYLDSASQFGFTNGMAGTIADSGLIIAVIQTTSGTVGKLSLLDPFTLAIVREFNAEQYMSGGATPSGFEAPRMNLRGDVAFIGSDLRLYVWPAGSVPVQIASSGQPTRIAMDEDGAFYHANLFSGVYWIVRIAPGSSTAEFLMQCPYRPRDVWYGYDGYLYVFMWDGSSNRLIWQLKIDGGSLVRAYTPTSSIAFAGSLVVAGDGSLFYNEGGQVHRVAPDWQHAHGQRHATHGPLLAHRRRAAFEPGRADALRAGRQRARRLSGHGGRKQGIDASVVPGAGVCVQSRVFGERPQDGCG